MRLRIVVTGLIAQHPHLGGVAWDYLQYPLGLHLLGHDVYYVEDSGEWPYTIDGGPTGADWVARDCTPNVEHLADVMRRFGLADRWAYRFPLTGEWFGLGDALRAEVLRTADLLINVSGTLEHPDEYRSIARLAYLDSDPIFTQIKLEADPDGDFKRRADAHDVHFSFGETLAERWSAGYRWLPTRQPIVLSQWDTDASPRAVFTTVMSWTSYRPLVKDGQAYAQKDVEFRKFLDLPRSMPGAAFEVALGGLRHDDWETGSASGDDGESGSIVDLLRSRSWSVIDATQVCSSLDDYRRYLQASQAEWSVAKNGYVLGQSGWFSCRSACYLAAGRPVVVQDTGFAGALPIGEGILSFASLEQAEAAVGDILGRYNHHANAAKALAADHFASGIVLSRLIEDAGGSRPSPPGHPSEAQAPRTIDPPSVGLGKPTE